MLKNITSILLLLSLLLFPLSAYSVSEEQLTEIETTLTQAETVLNKQKETIETLNKQLKEQSRLLQKSENKNKILLFSIGVTSGMAAFLLAREVLNGR